MLRPGLPQTIAAGPRFTMRAAQAAENLAEHHLGRHTAGLARQPRPRVDFAPAWASAGWAYAVQAPRELRGKLCQRAHPGRIEVRPHVAFDARSPSPTILLLEFVSAVPSVGSRSKLAL